MTQTLTAQEFERIARAASKDAANRSMRKAGRTAWSREDYNVAVAEYDRLMPESR